jgi:transmembrane protein
MSRILPFILESKITWLVARILISFVFISGGLAKIFDAQNSIAEIQAIGLEPAIFFNYAVATTLLISALFILFDRYAWLGAVALSVFLLLTIILVHRFWDLPADRATLALYFASEHISVIGGLMATAIASHLHHNLKNW